MYEAWERYKELLRRCPHHGLTRWMQIHNFYNGLNARTRTLIDASTGGALMKKTINEAYELLKDMETNSYQWLKERLASKRVAGVADVDVFSNLATQMSLLNKQLQAQKGIS